MKINRKYILGIGLLVAVAGQAATVHWNGGVDSQWNTAGNWSTGEVPGSVTSDIAILSGAGDKAYNSTPFTISKSCQAKLRAEAYLEITSTTATFDDIFSGSHNDWGGAHIVQRAGKASVVTVSDDLRIGHVAGVTSDSSYTIGGGSLSVEDLLYVNKGFFKVWSAHPTITAGNMTVASTGELIFDFDTEGVSPIVVSNALTIADGAKLTIDLRGYTVGGNVLELVKFSSLSGSFDPNDIKIVGADGGSISYDSDSINLTLIDEVSDFSKSIWFIQSALAGTDSESSDSVQINTGHLLRNLSSGDLNCTRSSNGNGLLYTVSWAGTDWDNNGTKDTFSFDLRVEGFAGSTYTYSSVAGASSVTALGSSATLSDNNDQWAVGTDDIIHKGETIRFGVENIQVSVSGVSVTFKGFTAMRANEPNGGQNDSFIIGEGTGLDSRTFSASQDLAFDDESPLVLTGAGSTTASHGWSIEDLCLEFAFSTPSIATTEDLSDYSFDPTGAAYRDTYPAHTDFSGYPEFSWDTVQRWVICNKGRSPLTDAEALALSKYQVVMFEKFNRLGYGKYEQGTIESARKVKKYGTNTKMLFYWNTEKHFDHYAANSTYKKDWSQYTLDADGVTRIYTLFPGKPYHMINYDFPEARQWWIDTAVNLVRDSEIDGVFIDKCDDKGYPLWNKDGEMEPSTGRLQMYHDLKQQMPAGSLIIGNTVRNERPSGNKENMAISEGSYLERMHRENKGSMPAQNIGDAKVVAIALMREATSKGKILMPRTGAGANLKADEEEIRERLKTGLQFQLAYFLTAAGPYSYFMFQATERPSDASIAWDTKWMDEFNKPLGEPLGSPVRDGYEFTRSFEHVDVWVNVLTSEGRLYWDWKPIANTQSLVVAENGSAAMTLSGYDPQDQAITYSVYSAPTKGVLSGTAPNLTYTPNADFTGEDIFTFKVNNGDVESIKATVSIRITNDDVRVPQFASETLIYPGAYYNGAYSGSLASSVTDADDDSLAFKKIAGSNWLEIAPDGSLSGIPANHNIGHNRWTVQATDSTGLATTAILGIYVAASNISG